MIITIELTAELETSIRAAVQDGRFASVDEAMTEAARLLVRELRNEPVAAQVDAGDPANPLLGLWHDYADELDEIVAEAYRQRQTDTWRDMIG